MTAATYNFGIEQGTTFLKPIIWKDSTGAPVNLTGCKARMQIRQRVPSSTVLLELTSEDNELVITPLLGKITITLSAAQTAAITWRRGRYHLEIETASGTVTRLLSGKISISREVTR